MENSPFDIPNTDEWSIEALFRETPANPMWVPKVISQEDFQEWAVMRASLVKVQVAEKTDKDLDERVEKYINHRADMITRPEDSVEFGQNRIMSFLGNISIMPARWQHPFRRYH